MPYCVPVSGGGDYIPQGDYPEWSRQLRRGFRGGERKNATFPWWEDGVVERGGLRLHAVINHGVFLQLGKLVD